MDFKETEFDLVLERLVGALRSRNVTLLPPARLNDVEALASVLGVDLDIQYQKLYQRFNGFGAGSLDPASAFRFWPLDEVVSNLDRSRFGLSGMVSFGDFLIGSNEILGNLTSSRAPILWDSGEVVAENLESLLSAIIEEGYDF